MKHLAPLVLLFGCLIPAARAESVSSCFAVHEMVKTEASRYLVRAVSRCALTYDAVYVMVSFVDAAGKHLGNGVWPIYWVRPGRPEIHEFGIPREARGFTRVVLHKITTDFNEVLTRDRLARN